MASDNSGKTAMAFILGAVVIAVLGVVVYLWQGGDFAPAGGGGGSASLTVNTPAPAPAPSGGGTATITTPNATVKVPTGNSGN